MTPKNWSEKYNNLIKHTFDLYGDGLVSRDRLKSEYQIFWHRKKQVMHALDKLKFDVSGKGLLHSTEFRELYKAYTKYLSGKVAFSLENQNDIKGSQLKENTTITFWNPIDGQISCDGKNHTVGHPYDYLKSGRNMYTMENSLAGNYAATVMDEFILIPDFINDEVSFPLKGKKCCVTGATNIRRETLAYMIILYGGTFQTAISKATDYLITVEPEGRKESTKTKKFFKNNEERIKEGLPIGQIISDSDFIKMLPRMEDVDLASMI